MGCFAPRRKIDNSLGLENVRLLGLRCEALWENVDTLSEIVGFPVNLPQWRAGQSHKNIDPETKRRYSETYRQLDNKISSLQDVILRVG